MLPFTKEELQKEIDAGCINVQKHPKYDLWIYNYSQNAQFEAHWNEVTLSCRGLILDKDFNVVARPFKKFFNFEEWNGKVLPSEEWEATEKLDGSLFICAKWKSLLITATRGSFTSEQARIARRILWREYVIQPSDRNFSFDNDKTYLFELIGPDNRIVVQYPENEIKLLAVIDNKTGDDLPIIHLEFPKTSFIKSGNTIQELFDLKSLNLPNKEGFVIRFKESGLRIKIKFEDYIRLHKVVTGVSSKTVWEYLKDDKSFDELLDKVPDEFYQWVKKTKASLQYQYGQMWSNAGWYYEYITNAQREDFDPPLFQTKKQIAEYVTTIVPKELRPIVFNMIDNKPYKHIIWRLIKPKYEQPFKTHTDER